MLFPSQCDVAIVNGTFVHSPFCRNCVGCKREDYKAKDVEEKARG
jgi:hypothetical protein